MVDEVIIYIALCCFLCLHYYLLNIGYLVFHVVVHWWSSYRHTCHALCLWLLFMFVQRFVNLVVDLDSIAFCFVQVCCLRRVCRSHFKMSVCWSHFVFGVVGVVVVVVVPWLLSLSVVHLYLLVTGTFFLKQVQVGNVGWEFVHGWRISFFVLGTLFVGFVCFSLEVHSFHGVDSFCLFCMCSLFYCLSQCRVGGS